MTPSPSPEMIPNVKNSNSRLLEIDDNTKPAHPSNPPIIVIFWQPYLSTRLLMIGPVLEKVKKNGKIIQQNRKNELYVF
jgi:hypothetical protein